MMGNSDVWKKSSKFICIKNQPKSQDIKEYDYYVNTSSAIRSAKTMD